MNKKKLILIIAVAFVIVTAVAVFVGVNIVSYGKINPKQTVKLSDFTDKTDGVRLIAHRGLSGIAPENTLPAFKEAGKAKYYGAECDVHLTTDGVWVIMHDGDTKKMCGKKIDLESSSFDRTQKLTVTNGANIEKYENLKIPRVEDYVEICVRYSVVPVIEIKNEDCSKETIQTLYDAVYSVDGVTDVIFISFKKQAIESIRAIDENAVCHYLVNLMKNEDIDWCSENGFGIDFNANNKKLEDETVKYAVSSGIDTVCWTVDGKDVFLRMLSLGVKTFTTNRILPEG